MTASIPDPLHRIRLVSLAAAAEFLAISKRTLQRLIAAGNFPAPIKVGSASRVRVADIECYIERQRRKAGS